MKIIKSDFKKGIVTLKIENLDDLWYLSHIIDIGDSIKGKTYRKIKLGGEEDRSSKVVKKFVTLVIKVEKIEFSSTSNTLRISGVVTDGPEDISHGSHHTFSIEENTIISVQKDKWLKFQIDKLKESSEQKTSSILICVFDRELATFALMKKYGFDVLTEFSGVMQKKSLPEKVKEDFFPQIITKLGEYSSRYNCGNIILASPAFFKEDLFKTITDDSLKKKIILATCNDTGRAGITEVLKRPEVNEVLKLERSSKEIKLVEKLLGEISKNNLAVYGRKQTKEAVGAGAVSDLLITDEFIKQSREKNFYAEIDYLMKTVDSMKGNIYIISSDHQGGKKLDGLGGIAALTRYKVNY